jgi:hypothetical protein
MFNHAYYLWRIWHTWCFRTDCLHFQVAGCHHKSVTIILLFCIEFKHNARNDYTLHKWVWWWCTMCYATALPFFNPLVDKWASMKPADGAYFKQGYTNVHSVAAPHVWRQVWYQQTCGQCSTYCIYADILLWGAINVTSPFKNERKLWLNLPTSITWTWFIYLHICINTWYLFVPKWAQFLILS